MEHDGPKRTLENRTTQRTNSLGEFSGISPSRQALECYLDAYHDYVAAIRLNRTKATYYSCRQALLVPEFFWKAVYNTEAGFNFFHIKIVPNSWDKI